MQKTAIASICVFFLFSACAKSDLATSKSLDSSSSSQNVSADLKEFAENEFEETCSVEANSGGSESTQPERQDDPDEDLEESPMSLTGSCVRYPKCIVDIMSVMVDYNFPMRCFKEKSVTNKAGKTFKAMCYDGSQNTEQCPSPKSIVNNATTSHCFESKSAVVQGSGAADCLVRNERLGKSCYFPTGRCPTWEQVLWKF